MDKILPRTFTLFLFFIFFAQNPHAQTGSLNSDLDELKIQKRTADSLFQVNALEQAVNSYKNGIEFYKNKKLNNKSILFELYADLSYCYAYDFLNDLDYQKKYLEQARLVLDENLVHPEKLINFYIDLSNVYKGEGILDKSLGFITKAKQTMNNKAPEFQSKLGESKYLELSASVLENEINILQLQKDETGLLNAYANFKEFFERNRSKVELNEIFGQANFRIGRYFQPNNVVKAVYFFDIAKDISQNKNLIVYSIICKGFSYINAKDYNNALQAIEQLRTFEDLNIYQELNVYEISSRCYSELGNKTALVESTNNALTLLNAQELEIDVLNFYAESFSPIIQYKYPILLNQFAMFLEGIEDATLKTTADKLFVIGLKQFADRIDHNPLNNHLNNYDIIKNRVLHQISELKLSDAESSLALSWMEQIETKSDFNSILLNRSLAENKSELDELISQERELRSEITEARQSQQEKDSLAKQTIFELELQLTDLNAKIRNENETVYQILNEVFAVQDLDLPSNTSVIKFDKAEDELFQIHLSKNGLKVASLGSYDDLVIQITNYLNILKDNSKTDQLNDLGNSLFEQLFSGVALTEETIIIADAALHYLPFETLRTNNGYLVEHTAISYANGLAYIDESAYKNLNYEENVTYFAPSYSKFVPSEAELAVRGEPYDLQGAKEEIKVLSKLIDGAIYENDKASKQQFMNLSNNFAIIHLAGHAFLNDSDPELSNIMFSDNIEDNKLYVSELYGLKNNAELAVLSACNTGVGGYSSGKGLVSLSQAFMFSGIPATVSSLWSAPDNATKDVMISFYKYLKEGNTKSKALQLAKLDYLSSTNNSKLNHPYYWAGFVMYGNNSPIEFRTSSNALYFWLTGGSIILLFGFGALIRKKRSSSS